MRNTYLVLFIYLMIPMFSLGENTYTTQQREDSLLSLLKSSPAINEQIELYKDLATMYRQMPKEIVYLNKMADVASYTSKGHASLYFFLLMLPYITHGPIYPAIITIYKTGIAWFTGRIR